MIDEGALGSLADHAYTLMGGIYSTRRVTEELIPALVQRVLEDEVDVVLLVPV